MKNRISGFYSRRGLLLNRGVLLVFGMLFSLSCLAAGAWAQSDTGATVDLTTNPSPPQKGSNTVLVKLTSKDGKSIDGAKVTVTFFMAAMPEMGMAAMKTVINASDKGGGSYEGKGDIGSSGSWQVTVKASKSGHVIATKKLTINVAGGM
jgi:hypothetical protein